ncbi:LysR family transcriptional regulator [Tranquillimonas alkanivorans]|uniref:DNA-binding transcriptional regulator, LysR family n=1 Tax=Tranquillimonas alkanivorans TaxID=441119 RepID=A0A1I5M3N2_9RHOB|nr:LysR family transcriptional regulator [Tranquillimonas alkanivorans]SFP04115.1 DNA-binding transcriptional regulator, LysR family [Tranquillimonas alkanivorans]
MSEHTGRDRLVRQGLTLRHLRLMAAVEETGQISAAAAQLSVSQPAASRMLSDIERLVGAKLYDRHPRGIVLNEAGALLAARARRTLRDLDETGHEIAQLSSGRRGRVEAGAVTGPALELVLPAIRQARVTHPEIGVNVLVDTSDKLGEALLSGRLDFYIGRLLDTVDPRAVSLRTIGPEPVSLIVREDHPLLKRNVPTLEECLTYDWVMQPPGGLLRRTAELYLLERGHPLPARVVSTSSLLVTLAIIGGSNAVAPVARSVAGFYASDEGLAGRIRTLPLATDMTVVPYSIVTRKDEPLPQAAEVFLRMIEARTGDVAR